MHAGTQSTGLAGLNAGRHFMIGEFEIIAKYFTPLAAGAPGASHTDANAAMNVSEIERTMTPSVRQVAVTFDSPVWASCRAVAIIFPAASKVRKKKPRRPARWPPRFQVTGTAARQGAIRPRPARGLSALS